MKCVACGEDAIEGERRCGFCVRFGASKSNASSAVIRRRVMREVARLESACDARMDAIMYERKRVRRLQSTNRFLICAALVALVFGGMMLNFVPSASAASSSWRSTTATWYGPGFYGNRTACGHRYTQRIRGVAIGRTKRGRWLARCGDSFLIRARSGRTVRVRVIDRCPGCVGEGHRFDLSARTAMDLCQCRRPYTMGVRWRAVTAALPSRSGQAAR